MNSYLDKYKNMNFDFDLESTPSIKFVQSSDDNSDVTIDMHDIYDKSDVTISKDYNINKIKEKNKTKLIDENNFYIDCSRDKEKNKIKKQGKISMITTSKSDSISFPNSFDNNIKETETLLFDTQEEQNTNNILIQKGHTMLAETIAKCREKANSSRKRSKWYKFSNNSIITATIFLNAIAGFISGLSDCQNIPVSVINLILTISQACYGIYNLSTQGIQYRNKSMELEKIIDEANEALLYFDTGEEIITYANQLKRQLRKLDVELYQLSYHTSTIDSNETSNTKVD